jgi:serine/threonine protein kinase
VHRDLKPENIFLHRPAGWPDQGEPTVKLMDFGVAKFTDGTGEARTEHGALLGTPEFMAPEQFRGATFAEPRTDIWAIGAILYRALTGRNAFGGPTVAATLIMVASEEPKPLVELAPDTPSGLVDVVNRCLRKHADRRFADVAVARARRRSACRRRRPASRTTRLEQYARMDRPDRRGAAYDESTYARRCRCRARVAAGLCRVAAPRDLECE